MREVLARRQGPSPWAGSAQQRQGDAGEEAVAAALRPLNDGYTLVRNLWLPGSAGDIDGVLLTPRGTIWVLEVKALAGGTAYRCRGMIWDYFHPTRRQWLRLDTQPSQQALFHATQVKRILDGAGLPSYPQAAVILANGARVALEAPRVPVVGVDRMTILVTSRHGDAAASPETLLQALLRAATKG